MAGTLTKRRSRSRSGSSTPRRRSQSNVKQPATVKDADSKPAADTASTPSSASASAGTGASASIGTSSRRSRSRSIPAPASVRRKRGAQENATSESQSQHNNGSLSKYDSDSTVSIPSAAAGDDNKEEIIELAGQDLFRYYPSLLTKDDLVEGYPWADGRITYNYVMTSYRRPPHSAATCVKALFTVHNELINAWTHYCGTLVALATLVIALTTEFPTGGQLGNNDNLTSKLVFATLSLSGIFMFSSSASFHTFCCHSDKICRLVQCMDWLGIAVHTFATNLVVSYTELRRFPKVFYIFTAINIFFAVFTYFVTYSALKKMYDRYDVQYNGHNAVKGESGGATNVPIFLRPFLAILESYAFRTLTAMAYALGSFFAWALGCGLTISSSTLSTDTTVDSTATCNDHLTWIILTYAFYGMVTLCLFDFPEKYVPRGALDIVVGHYAFNTHTYVAFVIRLTAIMTYGLGLFASNISHRNIDWLHIQMVLLLWPRFGSLLLD